MKRSAIICCALLLGGAAARAQQTSPFQVLKSKLSDVEFYTTNYGIFGLDIARANSGFIAPRGSGLSYIFGAGLWFGARKKVGKDTNDLVFMTYDPNTGASWARPDGGDILEEAERLYHSVNYDHATGIPTSPAAGDVPWPLWLGDLQRPVPIDPGFYETIWADRKAGSGYVAPAFMPGVAEQFVSRYNDADLGRYERITGDSALSIGLPLRLNITQNVYAWSDGPFKDLVMIQYEIRNGSRDTLFNCSAAQLTDADIGRSLDDHASYFTRRPDLRAAYMWTEPESGKNYKVLVSSIVEGPVVDQDGYVYQSGPAARKGYRQMGRMGTFQSWQIEEDPFTITQRYAFMTDRTQLDVDYGPGDRRTMMATTRFNMRPRDVAYFTVVYGIVDARPSETEKGSEMETLLEAVNEAYYGRESFVAGVAGERPAAASGMAIFPNPARDGAMVRFAIAEPAEGTLRLVNGLGEVVREERLGRLHPGEQEATLDLTGLPAGIYLASVTAGTELFTAKLTVTR